MSTDAPSESVHLTAHFPVPPGRVFHAWLDGAQHTAMSGGEATSDPRPGGVHTAWDGYIEGTWVAIEPAGRLVQTWRSSEFPADAPDSRLELIFAAEDGGCRLTLAHTEIPAGQGASYAQGWQDHYFTPMMAYFAAAPEQS